VLWSACTLAHLRKLRWQVSKQEQLVTIQYMEINNHEPSAHDTNNTHLLWTRVKSNMPLLREPDAS
jgi:hypothetical protein